MYCNPDFHSDDFEGLDFYTYAGDVDMSSFIWDKLPEYFHEKDTYKDGDGKGLLQRYLTVIEDEFTEEIIPSIECYINIIDINITEDKFINLLSIALGRPPDIFNDLDNYRKLLKYIVSVYKIKGTKASYELFFKLLGFDIVLTEIPPLEGGFRYDTWGEYDTGDKEVIYDIDPCPACSFYTIEFTPSPNSDITEITPELYNRLLSIVFFNEPINAKLAGLTYVLFVNDFMEVEITDESEEIIENPLIYDTDDEDNPYHLYDGESDTTDYDSYY